MWILQQPTFENNSGTGKGEEWDLDYDKRGECGDKYCAGESFLVGASLAHGVYLTNSLSFLAIF
jgi:hypothetical protein